MIVIDITFDMLKQLRRDQTLKMFYLVRDATIEMYVIFNDVLFRSIVDKPKEGEDVLFGEKYLRDAVPVLAISHVNEREWRDALTVLGEQINRIRELVEEIKDLKEGE